MSTPRRREVPVEAPRPRTTLYRSPSLSIIDITCRAHHRSLGAEEASDIHTVVFVRAGAFVREVGGRLFRADPTRVLFFTRGQPYRVAHPFEGGDTCTILAPSTETLIEIGCRHPDAPFPVLHAWSTPRSMLLHYALVVGRRRGELDALATQELALEVLDEALGAARPGPAHALPAAGAPAHRDLAEAAKAILLARYQSPPSLDELARALGCSPFHLSRTFSPERVAHRDLRVALRIRIFGAVVALVAIPLAGLFYREAPDDVGAGRAAPALGPVDDWTLAKALGSRSFWAVFAMWGFGVIGYQIVTTA